MATPLDEIRRSTGGLSTYNPSTSVQRALAPQPPQRQRPPVSSPGSSPISNVLAGAATDRRKKEDEGGGIPGLSQLMDLGEGALSVVDFGRRAAVLGVEEFATEVLGTDINDDDERSNWEKLSDISYGVNDLIDEDSMPSWMRSTLGFAGDVLLDPLTYLTAGVGGVAGKAGRAGYAAKAMGMGDEAVKAAATAAKAAGKEGLDDAAIKAIRSKYDDAATEIGRYGPGVIKDDAILEGIGLQKQGLRFGRPLSPGKGMRIGGDTAVGDALGQVARQSNQFFSKGRARFYDSALGGKLQDWRTPELISKAQRVIRSGQPEDNMELPAALALTTFHDANRMGSKAFKGRFSPQFDQLTKKMKGTDPQQAVRLAESADAGDTEWNQFFRAIANQAKESGVEFDTRLNYVPHIVSEEGGKALRKNQDLRKATGLTSVLHVDDASGVTMPRTFVEGKHTIDGVEVDFGKGTIDEINAALKPVIGVDEFFETNMTTIVPKYMEKMAADVGVMEGLGRLSKSFPDLVRDSKNPGGLIGIVSQITDEAATEVANKEAVSTLTAELNRARAAAGTTQKEVAEAVEQGRSILAGPAGEELKNIKAMRNSTNKRLANLEKSLRETEAKREEIVRVLDDELDFMEEETRRIRSELMKFDRLENSARRGIQQAGDNVNRRALAQQRATMMSVTKRRLTARLNELDASRDLLTQVNNQIRTNETKMRILDRATSDAPMPSPVTGSPAVGTQGESFVQLANSPRYPAEYEVVGMEPVPPRDGLPGAPGVEDPRTISTEQRRAALEAQQAAQGGPTHSAAGPGFSQTDPMMTEGIFIKNVENSGTLDAAQQAALGTARQEKTAATADVKKFLNSARGKKWLEDMREIDDSVDQLLNPTARADWSPTANPTGPSATSLRAIESKLDTYDHLIDLERAKRTGKVVWKKNSRMRQKELGVPVLAVDEDAGFEGLGASTKANEARELLDSRAAELNDQIVVAQRRIAEIQEGGGWNELEVVAPENSSVGMGNLPKGQLDTAPGARQNRPAIGKGLKDEKDQVSSRFDRSRKAVTKEEMAQKRQAGRDVQKKLIQEDVPDAVPARPVDDLVRAEEVKIARYQDDLAEINERLAALPEPPKPLNQGAKNVKTTAFRDRKLNEIKEALSEFREVRRNFKAAQKRTAGGTKIVNDLLEKQRAAQQRIDDALKAHKANLTRGLKGTDQSHLEIQNQLDALARDEQVAATAARRSQRDTTQRRVLKVKYKNGRMRLAMNESQIRDAIDDISTAGAPANISKEAQKAMEATPVGFRFDKGNKSAFAIADRVLDQVAETEGFRSYLRHVGAIDQDVADAHSKQVMELTKLVNEANAIMKNPDISQRRALANHEMRTLADATDDLRRSSEWMTRYAAAIDAGAEPSEALSRKVLRQVVDKDVKALSDRVKQMKEKPWLLEDPEVEAMTEVISKMVQTIDAATTKRGWNRDDLYRRTVETPAQEIAKKEHQLLSIQSLAEDSRRALAVNRGKRTRAIKKGDEQGIINADRAIARNQEALESSETAVAALGDQINNLLLGAESRSFGEMRQALEDLATKNAKILPENAPSRIIGPEHPRKFVPVEMNEQELRGLRTFFQQGDMDVSKPSLRVVNEADAEDVGALEDFLHRYLDVGDESSPELVELTNEMGGITSLNREAWVQQRMTDAAKIQSAEEIENARGMFSDIFDMLGLKRSIGSKSKEATVGFDVNRHLFNEKAMKKIVTKAMHDNRGVSSYDFVMKNLESRLARMKSLQRGLGKRQNARKEIVETLDPGASGITEGMTAAERKAARTRSFFDDATRLDDLEGLPATRPGTAAEVGGAERTAQQAAYERQLPLEQAREARIANIEGMDVDPGNKYVSVEQTLFGKTMNQRNPTPAIKPQGEQRARGLMTSRPEAHTRQMGQVTKGSPSAKLGGLQAQLEELGRVREGMTTRQADLGVETEGLRTQADELGEKISFDEGASARLQSIIDETVGTSLTPYLDDVGRRSQEFFDSEIGKRVEELTGVNEQMVKTQVEREKAIAEYSKEAAETRQTIRMVDRQLHGPSSAIPMGPKGWTEQPFQDTLPLGAPDNQLALPAAGETSGYGAGLDAKLAAAQQTVKAVRTAKGTALELDMHGVSAVNEQFEQVMRMDLGLSDGQQLMVRGLMADAVIQNRQADELIKKANKMERDLHLAKRDELHHVSKDQVLATWRPMAQEMMRDLPDEARYYMSTQLANYFTQLDNGMKDGNFWKAIAKYTAFFKTYATMRPDFHIRNAMSAVFMNSTDGVPVRYNLHALDAWRDFRSSPEDFINQLRANGSAKSKWGGLTNDEMADSFEVALGSGAGGQFAERGVGPNAGHGNKLFDNRFTRLSRKAGELVEGPVRLAVAMDAFKNKGMDKWDAFARVTRLHFDYADVSKMDEHAKRMIPFWTFMSRNLPLQLTQIMGKPKWYAGYNSFKRNFSDEGDPLAPEYWRTGGGFAARGKLPIVSDLIGAGDDEMWIFPDFAHNRIGQDVQNIQDLVTWENPGSMLTSLNPLFTTPAELAFRKDLFTGREYKDDDLNKLGGLEKGLEPILALLNKSEDGIVDEQLMNSMRGMIPFWDQANRLAPDVVSGQQPNDVRASQQVASWGRWGGLPIRQLTQEQMDSTARGNYYDARDEVDRTAAYERLLAES